MNIFKQLFSKDKNPNDNWKMFSTLKGEVNDLLIGLGEITIKTDTLEIKNYPFEPSVAFGEHIFEASDINNIDFKSHPPTLKIGNELIFISAEKKSELEKFAIENQIEIVERAMIWEWILEPFLDTEFTIETDERLSEFLESYGLSKEKVNSLRKEVEIQMLKYNFDTMLWEWCGLDASDVLRAMRTKYSKEKFRGFYNEVMTIALIPRQS